MSITELELLFLWTPLFLLLKVQKADVPEGAAECQCSHHIPQRGLVSVDENCAQCGE